MASSPSTIACGNIVAQWVIAITVSPVAVAANTSAEQTFTVKGLHLGDFVEPIKPSAQAGLGIVNSRVSANETLAITFINATGGSLTPTAGEVYLLLVKRPENVVNGLPALASIP